MSIKVNVPQLRFSDFSGEWEETKLGKICEFTQGVQISQTEQVSDYKQGYIRYLYIRDFFTNSFPCYVKDNYPNKIIQKNEIMMVNTGNTAGKAFMGETGVLSNNSFKISFNPKTINNYFLFVFLTSDSTQQKIRSFFNGAGQPHLGHKNISIVPFIHPKINEQEKIASFLSSVDTKVEQLTSKNKLLQEYKKGVMQKIFSQEIRFQDDDGSEYPEWIEKRLGDIATFFNSKRVPLTESDRESGIYPYYGASGIIDYVNDYIFDGEYILLGEDGANIIMRNSRLVFLANGRFWVNNHAHIFQAKESNSFLCEALERINYSKYNTGTAQPKLNSEVVKKIKINMPCGKEQTKIANFLSSIDSKIEQVQKQLDSTKEFKKALLQQMFV